jgi:hypothetical protein
MQFLLTYACSCVLQCIFVCLHNILIVERQYVQCIQKLSVYILLRWYNIKKIEVYYTRKAAQNDELLLSIKNQIICLNMQVL